MIFRNRNMVAIGEAMVELAPVEGGLYTRGFAGDTFNTAWHMAQILGDAGRIGYVTRIGQDVLSDAFVAELVTDGLDVGGISRDPDRTMGLYLIALQGVERSFHYWRSVSAARALADDPAALVAAIGQAGLVHLSGITLAILSPETRAGLCAVLAQVRADGAVISFDPNIRPRLWPTLDAARDAVSEILPLVDIALPSFDDEAMLWGDRTPMATVQRHVAAGVAEIVVKDGPGAVHICAEGRDGTVETPPVRDIRDTTGAGDAFNAGYLAARLMGHDAARAVAAGQALSAEVLRHPGARAPRGTVRALQGLLR